MVQSPFSGDDEEELFDSICNHQVSFSRYLDQTTISYLDKVSPHNILLLLVYMYVCVLFGAFFKLNDSQK